MRTETTRIANPIYDGAFKYLLDDNRIAKLFLSTILGEDIKELTFRPTEHRTDIEQRSVTVFRMDFAARIAQPGGAEKLVILEIQKAKFATDIMRFRKYLGTQYASKENVYGADGSQHALPILTIYFLGHGLDHTPHPVVRVTREYRDSAGKALSGKREEFIESLTHDSIIVQIPHLKARRQTGIECLLGIFDQSQKDPKDAHTLSIREEDYPKKFQPIIRRLIKAISEPDVREVMEVEDDYLEDLEDMERKVATLEARVEAVIGEKIAVIGEKDAVIGEKIAVIGQKDAVIGQKDAALEQKDAVIVEKDAVIGQKDAMLQNAIQALVASGMSEAEARAKLVGNSQPH